MTRPKEAVAALVQALTNAQIQGAFDNDMSHGELVEDAIALLDRIAPMLVAAEREACAVAVENYTTAQHVAHSIIEGTFPGQTDIRDAIAAALRGQGGKR